MHEINKARASQLLKSFASEDDIIQKSHEVELDMLEKAGPRAVIGETRMFGGRQYIKTASGWKFHGKGTGAAAQGHVVEAGLHHLNNAVAADKPADAVKTQNTPTQPSTADILLSRKLHRISHEITHYFHPRTGVETFKSFSSSEQLNKLKEAGVFKGIIDRPQMESVTREAMQRLSAASNRSEVYNNLKNTYDAELNKLGIDKKVGVSVNALGKLEVPTVWFGKPKEMVEAANKLSKDFYVEPFHNYTSCYLRIFKK